MNLPKNDYPRVRVKICGMTRIEDAVFAAQTGVDAIGLVFYPGSRRAVSCAQARAIVQALPAFVSRVALFVNPDSRTVNDVIAQVPIDTLQFHGSESEAFCQQFSLPYIKAIAATNATSIAAAITGYPSASALLIDSDQAGVFGGSGAVFNWDWMPRSCDQPLILAGGLSPHNVAAAIQTVRPYAVDVSSGVEARLEVDEARKNKETLKKTEKTMAGIKSAALIELFMAQVLYASSLGSSVA